MKFTIEFYNTTECAEAMGELAGHLTQDLRSQLHEAHRKIERLESQLHNSQPVSLQSPELRELVAGPENKIRAICCVRKLTGCGLKEAKDFVESAREWGQRD